MPPRPSKSWRVLCRAPRRAIYVVAALLWLALLACQKPANEANRFECSSCSWQLLGSHPQASTQTTSTGRALLTLHPWRGLLYIGYGDYQQNTGPVDVTAWDPARRAFTRMHSSDTEAIYNYRALGDSLYAPATDRRERADYAVGPPWRDELPLASAHAYDMATLDGRDLWLVGSAEGPIYLATAWRSTDGGTSWKIAHQPGGGRYYFAAIYRSRLYLERWLGQPLGPSEVFDGTSWTRGPELLPLGGHGVRPVEFADRLVYATKLTFDGSLPDVANRLLTFDGATVAVAFDRELLDFFAAERDLFVLDAESVVWRTRDLLRWSRVSSAAGLQPRSVALLDGHLYLGTSDSKLYRLAGWP